MSTERPDFNDVHDRETAWRQLAHDLFARLAECRLQVKRGRTKYLGVPVPEELEKYAARFRALSEAAGWTLKAIGTGTDDLPMKMPKRPWWKFWARRRGPRA